MPKQTLAAISLPVPLYRRAVKFATAKHGPRSFSRYIRFLIVSDLLKNKS